VVVQLVGVVTAYPAVRLISSRARDFVPGHNGWTGSGTHPASYAVSIWSSFVRTRLLEHKPCRLPPSSAELRDAYTHLPIHLYGVYRGTSIVEPSQRPVLHWFELYTAEHNRKYCVKHNKYKSVDQKCSVPPPWSTMHIQRDEPKYYEPGLLWICDISWCFVLWFCCTLPIVWGIKAGVTHSSSG
jgi:hypothetical protein